MTPEQIDELPPGREMDEAVAAALYGPSADPTGFRFSANRAEASWALAKLEAQGRIDKWDCYWDFPDGYGCLVRKGTAEVAACCCPTLPVAICRAVLAFAAKEGA